MSVKNYILLLRPKHWVKSLFIFAPPFFGGRILSKDIIVPGLISFFAFSLCASAGYILNDIQDSQRDRLHPQKRQRPISAGLISIRAAVVVTVIIAAVSFYLSLVLGYGFLFYTSLYLVLQVGYTQYLKNIAVVDIFPIAAGFVIRVLAGGQAFSIEVSDWLLLTMFMLSLMLAAGKRLGECYLLNDQAKEHRKSLTACSPDILHDILLITSSSSLIAYAMYTLEQSRSLIYTVPFVTFGLFRYILLSKEGRGDPTEALTHDRWLAGTVLMWLILVAFIRYNY